ncbi:MAG: nucleotidyltransferase family protein [Xenococcaceae cyanobacterium]
MLPYLDKTSSKGAIAAVILAAGASTRMGTPKQLLLDRGQSLLRRVTETAIAAHCSPIFVVLGAYSDRIRCELKDLPVQVVENLEWQKGMGSSIRHGIQALMKTSPIVEAVILLLCDQPFVSAQTIHQLESVYRSTNHPIIASAYQNTIGVPALFDSTLFLELTRLTQAEGAKKVIQRHINSVVTVEFPQGAIDLDTPNDYQIFKIVCRDIP